MYIVNLANKHLKQKFQKTAWPIRGPHAARDGLTCSPSSYIMTNWFLSSISKYILNRIQVIKRNKVLYNYLKNPII